MKLLKSFDSEEGNEYQVIGFYLILPRFWQLKDKQRLSVSNKQLFLET